MTTRPFEELAQDVWQHYEETDNLIVPTLGRLCAAVMEATRAHIEDTGHVGKNDSCAPFIAKRAAEILKEE